MTEREIAEVLRAVLLALGWVNLADPAVCHGGHAACVHVVEDMKLARRSADYWQGQANAFGAEIAMLTGERGARLARLGEALLKAGERFHGLSADPQCMAHVFAACPRYVCSEVRAALADAGAGKEQGQ